MTTRPDLTVVTDQATVVTDQATDSTGLDARIGQHRRAGITVALVHLRDGNPGRALYTMVRSVEWQARVAELGAVQVGRDGGDVA